MDNLPYQTKLLVLEQTGRSQYTLWHKAKGQGLISVHCDMPLEVGKWFIRDAHGFVPLPSQPHNTALIRRNDVNMIRATTIVVRPLPSYFDSDDGMSKKKFMKYFGVSCDFGIVFVNGALMEQMEYGVPYEMFIASFGMNDSSTEARVLKAMKTMGTVWLASKQQLVQAKINDGILFTARMRVIGIELLEIPGATFNPYKTVECLATRHQGPAFAPSVVSDSSSGRSVNPARSFPSTSRTFAVEPAPEAKEHQTEHAACPYKVTKVENELEMWAEIANRRDMIKEQYRHYNFESEEGKKKTREVLERMLANPKICDAFKKAGAGANLDALRKIMPPTTTTRPRPE